MSLSHRYQDLGPTGFHPGAALSIPEDGLEDLKLDSFEELQVELETVNVLIRVLTPTRCVLTAVVDKTAPLGLALILMKKFHGKLLSTATT